MARIVCPRRTVCRDTAGPGLTRQQLRTYLIHYGQAMLIHQTLLHLLNSRPYKIEGNSMRPALIDGQYVLLTRAPRTLRPLERGDIVVHRHPMGLDGIFAKRIIGLPGEHVRIEGGQVYLDEVPLEEDYPVLDPDQEDPPLKEWWNDADEYVVLGDNRRESRDDSRAFGSVPAALILGQVWLCYWPPRSWGVM